MTDELNVRTDDGVCTLEIDNRAKRNAITIPHVEAIVAELDALADREDVRAVVIRGAGPKAFCSGYDISKLSEDIATRGRKLERMADVIYHHPYPTIAMLNGATIGAGFLIATACDLRVAVAGASIGVPSAKLGVIYTSRGIELAVEVAGTAATKELLFVGETVTAERARDMGLVNHVVDRDELEDHTYDIATRIASNAPLSLTGTKEIIHALRDSATFDETDEEWIAELRQRAFDSRDHEEGKRAFAENRDPEFEGR